MMGAGEKQQPQRMEKIRRADGGRVGLRRKSNDGKERRREEEEEVVVLVVLDGDQGRRYERHGRTEVVG